MFKLLIRFDDKKVRDAGEYDISDLYNTVDRIMRSHNLIKEGMGVYHTREGNSGFGDSGNALDSLENQDWFMTYIKNLIWEQPNGVQENVLAEIEDMKKNRLYGY